MKSIKFNGLDDFDLVKIVGTKKNAYLKLALESLEREGLDKESFLNIRKIFLDNFNEFERSILRVFIGDVEK